jgi:flavin-dependent dehydrogenase
VLDPALCHAAAQAGAMFHDRSQVVALIFEDGRVCGVRVRSTELGHEEVQIRARIVIGADGVHSVVAKQVAAPEYDVVTSRTCSYRSYWSGVECGGLEYFRQGEQSILLMPTHGGLTWISVGSPIERLGELRRDVERGYLDAIHSVPELRDRIEEGVREERIVGMAVPKTFRRRPYGPGWALVGDAGYHRDPSGGQGITDAFRDAELVARAADDTLSGGADEGSAFADYERTRNAFSASGYALSDLMARGGDRSSDPAKLFAAFGPARPADGRPPLPERAPTIAPSAVFED